VKRKLHRDAQVLGRGIATVVEGKSRPKTRAKPSLWEKRFPDFRREEAKKSCSQKKQECRGDPYRKERAHDGLL